MDKKTELQQNFFADARRKEKQVYQRSLDLQWMYNRMEDGRTGRCLALIQREADMEKAYQEQTDHAALVNARAAKEAALGYEVATAQMEQDVAYQRRHIVRNDPSLKTLAKKLQAGYVCRDLQLQIRNNEYRRLEEKAKERHALEQLDKNQYTAIGYQEHINQERAEAKAKYCQELQQQLVFKQTQKQCQYEDTLIEKKMLDEVMRTIADEDKRELQNKREQMEKTRREMVTFKQAQEAWRAKQKQMVILEEKDLERQRQAISDRDTAVLAERVRRQKLKEETAEKIAAVIQANELERQEREGLLTLLQQQEKLEADIQGDINDKAKLERIKHDNKTALNEQMQIRKQQEAKEKEFAADYLKQLKVKMAEEEEKEKEKQRRVQVANRKHCDQLLRQAEVHRKYTSGAREEEELRAKATQEYEKNWLAEVAKERELIIKEHVPHILGYLQAGVIKKEDLPIVREGANLHPELAKLQIENLTQTARPKRFSKCNAQCRILREY